MTQGFTLIFIHKLWGSGSESERNVGAKYHEK